MHPEQGPVIQPADHPVVQKEIAEIDEALRTFAAPSTAVQNPGSNLTSPPSSLPVPPSTSFTPVPLPVQSSLQPQFHAAPHMMNHMTIPLFQPPVPSPQLQMPLVQEPSSHLLQVPQTPNTAQLYENQTPIQVAPAHPQVALAQPQVTPAQLQAAPAQAEETAAPALLVQAETQAFVPTQQFPVPTQPPVTSIQTSSSQFLNTRGPVQIMVQLPVGTTHVSQQPVTDGMLPFTETSTTTPVAGDLVSQQVVALVNSATPLETSVSLPPGKPSLPPLSSSQTSWPPSLSSVSSSLASLPLAPLLSQPVSLPPPLTTATASAEAPTTSDQKSQAPTAKAVDPGDLPETVLRNNEIYREHPQLELPPSNMPLKKLQSVKTGRDYSATPSNIQDRGISYRKPVTFL